MRSKDLGKPVPITLKSDPSEEQGHTPLVWHCRYMDAYQFNRYQQIARKAMGLKSAADGMADADTVVDEQIELVASLVAGLDNWDDEPQITDTKRLMEIMKILPNDMTVELFSATVSYKELLKLKNQSPSGSKRERPVERQSPSAAMTPTTADLVSAEGDQTAQVEYVGEMKEPSTECSGSILDSNIPKPECQQRPQDTLQRVD